MLGPRQGRPTPVCFEIGKGGGRDISTFFSVETGRPLPIPAPEHKTLMLGEDLGSRLEGRFSSETGPPTRWLPGLGSNQRPSD